MPSIKRSIAGAAIALVTLCLTGVNVLAASPSSGTIKPGSTVTWTGGPLNGAQDGRGNELCQNGVNCDDFALDIEVPATLYAPPSKPVVHISIATSDPNQMHLLLYPPGATTTPGSSVFINYSSFDTDARLQTPKDGVWTVRVACTVCADATYTAKVTVEKYTPPPLEALGDFSWANLTLPGKGEGEPNITSWRDKIYINAPAAGKNGAGVMWRSDDNGKTFKRVGDGVDTVQPQITGDTDLAVAPDDGTVYFANLTYTAFANYIYASSDNGDTWTGPAVAGVDSDRQWLATAPNGVVYLAYHDTTQMWMWKSTDHGKTFLTPYNFNLASDSYPETTCGNHMTRPLIDPKDPNIIYEIYSTSEAAGCYSSDPSGEDHYLNQLWLAKTTDGGMTWTNKQIYTSEHHTDHNLSAATLDSAGNIYMAFSESGPVERRKEIETDRYVNGIPNAEAATAGAGEGDNSTHVRLLVSTDKGETWSKPILVDKLPDHHSNVFATVAAADPGHVALAWYTSRASSFDDADASWTVAEASTSDATSATPHFAQTRVSPSVVHTGSICQSGLACTVSGYDRNLLDFMGITIGSDGMAKVVYNNDTSGDIKVEFGRQTAGLALRAVRAVNPAPKPKPVVKGKRVTKHLPATGVDNGVAAALLLMAVALLGRRLLRVS